MMTTIETLEDYIEYLKNNREKLLKNAVRIEDLPADNDWVNDDAWDEIYKRRKDAES